MQISTLPIDVTIVVPQSELPTWTGSSLLYRINMRPDRGQRGKKEYRTSDLPYSGHQRDSEWCLPERGKMAHALCVGPGHCPSGSSASFFRNLEIEINASHRFPKNEHHRERKKVVIPPSHDYPLQSFNCDTCT